MEKSSDPSAPAPTLTDAHPLTTIDDVFTAVTRSLPSITDSDNDDDDDTNDGAFDASSAGAGAVPFLYGLSEAKTVAAAIPEAPFHRLVSAETIADDSKLISNFIRTHSRSNSETAIKHNETEEISQKAIDRLMRTLQPTMRALNA